MSDDERDDYGDDFDEGVVEDYGDDMGEFDVEEEGEGRYGDEKGAYDRTNKVDEVDMKNPKERFKYELGQRMAQYGVFGDSDGGGARSKIFDVVDSFNIRQCLNYNPDGILLGFMSRKINAEKKFISFAQEYKQTATIYDILRYKRLWNLHLDKIKKGDVPEEQSAKKKERKTIKHEESESDESEKEEAKKKTKPGKKIESKKEEPTSGTKKRVRKAVVISDSD